MRKRVGWKVVFRHEEEPGRVFSDARMMGRVVCTSIMDGWMDGWSYLKKKDKERS